MSAAGRSRHCSRYGSLGDLVKVFRLHRPGWSCLAGRSSGSCLASATPDRFLQSIRFSRGMQAPWSGKTTGDIVSARPPDRSGCGLPRPRRPTP